MNELHLVLPGVVTMGIGALMVQIGVARHRVESKYRRRWCGSCHRRITGPKCDCLTRRH